MAWFHKIKWQVYYRIYNYNCYRQFTLSDIAFSCMSPVYIIKLPAKVKMAAPMHVIHVMTACFAQE